MTGTANNPPEQAAHCRSGSERTGTGQDGAAKRFCRGALRSPQRRAAAKAARTGDPTSEYFDRNAKGRCAFRLGRMEPRSIHLDRRRLMPWTANFSIDSGVGNRQNLHLRGTVD
jgi:hypothetical protein